jgi:Domain of unknown function (DUF4349)
MRSIHSNLIACGLTAVLLLGIAACSKQESAAEATTMAAADAVASAEGGAMPASAPMPQEAAKAVAEESASGFSAAGDAAAVAPEQEAKRRSEPQVEFDTRVDAGQVSSSAATFDDGQRKFIRTAQAEFRVKDVYSSALAIEDVAAQQGGFIVNNNISAQTMRVQRRPAGDGKLIELVEYTVRGTLSVRVPSDKTQTFLRAIASQMEFLDQRSFDAADAQFQVLRQQLAYQREQQAQMELGQAMQAGERLDRKSEVIAARTGAKLQRDEALIQQKEFEDKVDYSTINLTLYQLSKIRQTEMVDVEAVFQKHSPGFFTRLFDALRVGWYGVLDLFIGLMNVWPLWLVMGLGLYGLRRWAVSRRKQRPVPPPQPAAE